MKEKSKIKATALFSLAYFVSNGLNTITIPIFTRILTKTDYGIWGTCNNLQLFSTNLFRLGCQQSFLKQFYDYSTENERQKYLLSIIFFMALWSILLISLFTLIIEFIGFNSIYEIQIWPFLYLSVLISLLTSIYAVFESEIRLLGLAKKYLVLSIFVVGGNLALSLFFILKLELGVLGKFYGTIIPYIIFLPYLLFQKKEWNGVRILYWLKAVKFGFPLGLNSLIFSLVWSYIYIRLNSICDLDSVGGFHVARTFGLMLPEYAFQAIVLTYQPYIYKALAEKRISSISKYNTLFLGTLTVCVVFFFLFAKPIIMILATEKYLSFVTIIRLLLFSFIFKVYYYYPMLKLLADDKSKVCMYIQTFSLFIMCAIVELFIYNVGMIIIPIAIIIQEIMSLLLFFFKSRCNMNELFNIHVLELLCKK